MKKQVIKSIYLLIGSISLVLGALGIFLPLLPTTPFLLLTAYCYSRSSEKFHLWLIHHEHLGQPIRDWESKGVIRMQYKLMATTMLLISAVFIFSRDTIPAIGKIGFSVCAGAVLLFIWTRPSY